MTVASAAGAPPVSAVNWNAIDWRAVHKQVNRLQVRIAKAVEEKRFGKVKALQWLLTHSWTAKLWAVRRVTTNKGKNTPGVDGVLWRSSKAKIAGALSLKRHGYKPKPLRRVYIPKSRGRFRPLGIPTFHDRAMQALHALALEPVAECLADRNSYGFRQRRSTADAIAQLFIVLSKSYSAEWILDADILACFDGISHDWLLQHIVMDKVILRMWLKAGYLDRHVFHPTEAGTPQGGIISPILANMTLDGLEAAVRRQVPRRGSKVNLVRYADDFGTTGSSRELLEEAVVPEVRAFLDEREIGLSPEKTRIVHIDEGFDFLGFNVRKYDGKLLIKPAKKKVLAFVRSIRKFIKTQVAAPTAVFLRRLNAKLRGWGNYYRHAVATRTFEFVQMQVHRSLKWWMRRRHPNHTPKWRRKRYFRRHEGRWRFHGTYRLSNGQKKVVYLFQIGDLRIRRHVKVRGEVHPFDHRYDTYFRQRRRVSLERRRADRRFFTQFATLDSPPECDRDHQRQSTQQSGRKAFVSA